MKFRRTGRAACPRQSPESCRQASVRGRALQRIFFSLLVLVLAGVVRAGEDFPQLTLGNGEIEVLIYLPDANRGYYRGTRFDWSGIIGRVDYQGHSFYAPLHEQHDPQVHDSISGPADEFAMFNPMGFAEAAPGESFVKIGVGLLARGDSDEYQFYGDYEILHAGEWKIRHDASSVTFEQDLTGERGWAYRYRKSIRLLEQKPGFDIQYRLENSGDKPIDISQYNHNFTLIDNLPFGPEYRVEFPFSADQPQSINDLAWFRGNAIEVERKLGDKSLWAQLYEGDASSDYNAAVVRNLRSGAAVAFSGDMPIERMVFWAVERAASPEPFGRIKLQPGEVKNWSSRYLFSVDTN